MKRLKRVFALILAISMIFGMTACQSEKDSSIIYVEASLAGYRRQWLDGIAEKYTEKTGVQVEINWDSSLTTNISEIMDMNANMSDLYYVNLSNGSSEFQWYLEGKLESLNDVFSADNGTGITIEQSLQSSFVRAGLYKDVRFAAYTVSGYDCLVYNPDILEKAGWNKAFPQTVDELVEMFELINDAQLKAADGTTIKPFVYTGIYDSILHLFDAFEVQYGGVDEYAAFYQYNSTTVPSKDNYYKKSTKVAFENLIKLMAVGNNGVPKYVLPGSAGMTHTEAQTAFLNGYAAVCTTGTWFETEMNQIIEPDDKYEIAPFPLAADENGSYGEAENHLIDPNGEKVPSNMMKYNIQPLSNAPFYIPTKAQNKEGAKDFLRFVLQEENLRYIHEQTGNASRYTYNRENLQLNDWAKKIEENNKITLTGIKGGNTPIYWVGALGGIRQNTWSILARTKDYDYMSELDFRYNDMVKNWAEKMELV